MINLIKIGIGLVIILMVIQGYNYVNLKVSEKYETQLEGIVEITEEVQKNMDEQEEEIDARKSQIIKYTALLGVLLVALLILRSRYRP